MSTPDTIKTDITKRLFEASHILSKRGNRYDMLESRIAELEEYVSVDPVSDCFNKNGFERVLKIELARLSRYAEKQGSIIMVSIENLDDVLERNEEKQDRIIELVSHSLKQHIRDCDIIARVGPYDFAVLFSQTSVEQATKRTTYFLRHFDNLVFFHNGVETKLKISIAFLAFDENDTAQSILKEMERIRHK